MPAQPDDLDPASAPPDPLTQFEQWYAAAGDAGVLQPEAMTVATATRDGAVSARTVLLRGFDERGFVFYTNFGSAKGRELADNPHAALVFHWREQERQVRVVGPVERVASDEATAYWANRPLGHRISAWASPQSDVIDRADLGVRIAEVEVRFSGDEPPLPPFWGGLRVRPQEIEFWQGRRDRVHDRLRYRREGARSWARERLAP